LKKTFLLGFAVALIVGFLIFKGATFHTPALTIPSTTVTQPPMETNIESTTNGSPYDNSSY